VPLKNKGIVLCFLLWVIERSRNTAFCFLLSAFSLLLLSAQVYGQNPLSNSSQNSGIISNFKHLAPKQLLDTANYYFKKNGVDTALICYSLIINSNIKNNDVEHYQRVVEALNKSANIYCQMWEHRTAFNYFIKALLLCEKYDIELFKAKILNNIGHIYFRFHKYEIAKSYFKQALDLCKDSVDIVLILNNIGASNISIENYDSAFYYLTTSLELSKRLNNVYIYNMLNNLASYYEKRNDDQSAFNYFHLALNEARNSNEIEKETGNLSELGKLFMKTNKPDSALYYVGLSNILAKENNFLGILSENYLTLSKIERSKGNITCAFKYYEIHSNLKDSVYNVEIFGDINQLQHLYEVSKINQQIEQLAIEQQISERTISLQKINQFITLSVLILVSFVLLYIFIQKRKLNTAYRTLFEKNLEIITLQDNSSEEIQEKYRKSALTDDMQFELLNRILILMEEPAIICAPDFSIDKLTELVQSNRTYVSQVINTALKKNFRSFLNGYRIREAQRLFSDANITKYTIESVAQQIGFKSQSAFYEAFKEITGVSPNFYLKSIQGKSL
jgi:AraC-like DNA-binding protein/tetratricopeptide (TPR) repeat protein